jgi:hypothetical protein
MKRIISLYSPRPGCGKSSIAKALECKGWIVVSFAEPLRRMVITFLVECGIDPLVAKQLVTDTALKDLPLEKVPGNPTPRHLMRTLGTEWGRDCVTQKLWTEIARAKARVALSTRPFGNAGVVFDDMRFATEYDMAVEEGALTVYLDRPQAPPLEGDHRSDGALDDADFVFDETVINDSEDKAQLTVIAHRLIARAAGLLKPKDEAGWSGPKAYREGPDGKPQALFVRGGEVQWRPMLVSFPEAEAA